MFGKLLGDICKYRRGMNELILIQGKLKKLKFKHIPGFMGNQLELFVDNWLKNETRKSVDRVMKSMIYEWTEASHVEALQDK